MVYLPPQLEVIRSNIFDAWLSDLKDREARAQILKRITRLQRGNFGDAKRVARDVSELRIDSGPGYRVYYTQRGSVLVLLLCGGIKKSQDKDIQQATHIARAWDGK
jgi:putative addiction module killer protein